MQMQDDLESIESELLRVRAEYTRLGARITGLTAEREALRAAIHAEKSIGDAPASDPDLMALTKDRAIVHVLRGSTEPMRIGEIVEVLNAAGRTENYNGVSVYLDTLLKQGRVKRVGRGLYEPDRP